MAMSTDPESLLHQPLALASLAFALIAATLVVFYLVRKPRLVAATKILLALGLGVFPILAAGSGNVAGFDATTKRSFCNGCHVMEPWIEDAANPASTSLASLHSRNQEFGPKSCYACHADYGMFGTVATKINGLKHVAAYITEYRDVPIAQAIEEIRLYKPYPNTNCTHCHSTKLPGFDEVPDHKALVDPDQVSCASIGCHGPAHPFAGGSR
jgi:cytochrome c-type protein NapC